MNSKTVWLFSHLLLFSSLFSCENGNNKETQEARERLTQSIRKSNQPVSKFSIGILTEVLEEDSKTGTPRTEINLISPQFPEHLLLARDFNYVNIAKKDWVTKGIPKEATLAFQSRFKGKGADYYLTQKEDVLEIMKRSFLEGDQKELEHFRLFRSYNLNKRNSLNGTYLCFQSDEEKDLRMSVYISADAKARAMKFERKKEWTHLTYNTSVIQGEEANPTFMDQYLEYYRGKKIGIFNLTHSDEWDYVQYSRYQDGKEFNFTVDHEATLVDGENRKTACFEN